MEVKEPHYTCKEPYFSGKRAPLKTPFATQRLRQYVRHHCLPPAPWVARGWTSVRFSKRRRRRREGGGGETEGGGERPCAVCSMCGGWPSGAEWNYYRLLKETKIYVTKCLRSKKKKKNLNGPYYTTHATQAWRCTPMEEGEGCGHGPQLGYSGPSGSGGQARAEYTNSLWTLLS